METKTEQEIFDKYKDIALVDLNKFKREHNEMENKLAMNGFEEAMTDLASAIHEAYEAGIQKPQIITRVLIGEAIPYGPDEVRIETAQAILEDIRQLRKKKNWTYEVQELYNESHQQAFVYGVNHVAEIIERKYIKGKL